MDKENILRYLIKMTEKQGLQRLAELLEPLGVTPSQSEVLLVLSEHEPLSLKEIGCLIICEKNFPSRLLQKLVEKGLVLKTISAKDSRVSVLQLTKSGRSLIPQIIMAEKRFNQEIQQQLGSEKAADELIARLSQYLAGTEGLAKIERRIALSEKE